MGRPRRNPASIAGTSTATRCAVYTRKSTDEGLDQEFNSLDAQFEACASFIASQRHEGWTSVRERYDDGGYSGGSMERPALKRLLDDVAAGRIQVIVLYKIDRLTRSLADFARIVDILDGAGASFVSVTQSFNTTTSMGRLTLNMLLSFAQFEREVTAERIRDKVAASKAKGIWMGGVVPLGYRVDQRKLLVDEPEAETVRHIFRRYVALGSGGALLAELRAEGIHTKPMQLKDGRQRGGIPFTQGPLYYLLSNRVYRGETVHKGIAYPGEHDPIIDEQLWDQVQGLLATNRVERRTGSNAVAPSLLAGRIVDGFDRSMTASHAAKPAIDGGTSRRRYRYYITHPAHVTGDAAAWRIAAHDVEASLVDRLRTWLGDRNAVHGLVDQTTSDASTLALAFNRAEAAVAELQSLASRRSLVLELVSQVRLREDNVAEIRIDRGALMQRLGLRQQHDGSASLILEAPLPRIRIGKEVRVILNAGRLNYDKALVALLVEAKALQAQILAEPGRTIKDIAASTGRCRHRLARLLRLSWLAPSIVEAILKGRPVAFTGRQLLSTPLSARWNQQEELLLSRHQA